MRKLLLLPIVLFAIPVFGQDAEITGFDNLALGMTTEQAMEAKPHLKKAGKLILYGIKKGWLLLAPYLELENGAVMVNKEMVDLFDAEWGMYTFFENDELKVIALLLTTYSGYDAAVGMKKYAESMYRSKYGKPVLDEVENTVWKKKGKRIRLLLRRGEYDKMLHKIPKTIYIIIEAPSSVTEKTKEAITEDRGKI